MVTSGRRERVRPGTKASWYYEERRSDMVAALPRPLGRVLDVGCGAGTVGAELRADADRLVGIEIDAAAAERASRVYDEVIVGSVETVVGNLDEPFDTILCYDVLEHLVDPWRVLDDLYSIAAAGARLHVSVPNARHPSFGLGLVLKGTVGYETAGLRDVTHLRWFTRRDISDAVTAAGWEIVAEGHNPISRARALAGRLTGGRALEFLVGQLHVLAVKAPRR
jgi:2-polyprenyl-3-methyl-5-hydroxy-6-metoxy-1,4-benzoquinol methylase